MQKSLNLGLNIANNYFSCNDWNIFQEVALLQQINHIHIRSEALLNRNQERGQYLPIFVEKNTFKDCTCPTPAPTPVVTSTPAPQPDAGFIAVKFNDLNGNGSKQDTEPGLSWNFEWDRNGNNTWTAYETYGDRNGQGGRLGDLVDGDTIRVREKSKDGWRATTTTQHSIVVHKNETAVVYFGNQQTSSKVLATCNGSCSSNGDCVSGYTCSSGMCRNASCTSSSSCVCTSTTKTTTVTPKATAKPAAAALYTQALMSSEK